MLAPYRSAGRLAVLQPYRPVAASTDGDRVTSVTVEHRDTAERLTHRGALHHRRHRDRGTAAADRHRVRHRLRVAARHRRAERPGRGAAERTCRRCRSASRSTTSTGDHTIDRPAQYDFWRDYQPLLLGRPAAVVPLAEPAHPGHQRAHASPRTRTTTRCRSWPTSAVNPGDGNLWTFRRIAARKLFTEGAYDSDICLVNWPMIDYFEGPVIDVPDAATHLANARELSRSVLYWLQTEAGFPGLRLRGDVTGRDDGLAQAPYIRESRRIRAEYTVVEQDLSLAVRGDKGAVSYPDAVGVGMYRIDLHPSTGGDNYIDVGCLPVRDPARRAHSAAAGEPAAGQQEHRHHPHHQRLLPAAPGRVEHRRGRRRARRVLPEPQHTAPRRPQHRRSSWPASRHN